MDKVEERVKQLEEVTTHQEHTIHQLNEVLIEVRKQVDELQAEFRRSVQELRDAINSEPFDPDEKPPHY